MNKSTQRRALSGRDFRNKNINNLKSKKSKNLKNSNIKRLLN